MDEDATVHLDSDMVLALAHPMRARLLGVLRSDGPATATGLAKKLGTNSGATSYHLRRLAKAGLVVDDPGHGSGRERWWRAAHRSHSWRDTEHDRDPQARAAADWLIRNSHRHYSRGVEQWLDARTEWPVEWRNAADQSDYWVTVTPDQLTTLNRRVGELVERYRDAANPDDPRAERVTVLYYAYPTRAAEL